MRLAALAAALLLCLACTGASERHVEWDGVAVDRWPPAASNGGRWLVAIVVPTEVLVLGVDADTWTDLYSGRRVRVVGERSRFGRLAVRRLLYGDALAAVESSDA